MSSFHWLMARVYFFTNFSKKKLFKFHVSAIISILISTQNQALNYWQSVFYQQPFVSLSRSNMPNSIYRLILFMFQYMHTLQRLNDIAMIDR